jgi:hypothetical protein
MDPVVTGSEADRPAADRSAGRLAFTSITAEKQQSARAAIQRTPLAVRIVRLDMRMRVGGFG